MPGLNKVILVGNLGNDPESRTFDDGTTVTNASVATSETWKDRQTGEKKEKTEWHRVVFRDRGNYKLGAIAAEYLTKGTKVCVEGKLQTRKWQKDGVDQYTTEIQADSLEMLSSRTESAGGLGSTRPSVNPAGDQGAGQSPSFDDDIPF